MAINTKPEVRPYSDTHILNQSFDSEFQVSVVELLSFDPLSGTNGALKRVTTNSLGEYRMNDREDGADTYIGMEDPDGSWFIQKITESSGTQIRYASIRNNASTTTYSDAWTNRASLTYDTYSVAF